jgi:hypothetical protein
MRKLSGLALVLLIGFSAPVLAQRSTVFPHFASGSGWLSVLFFTNQGLSSATVTVNSYGESGEPITIESDAGRGSVLKFDLGAGATRTVRITPSTSLMVGSLVVTCPSSASIRVTEVFSFEQNGTVLAEVGVSQLYGSDHYSFPVEINSFLGINTAVAFANPPFLNADQTIIANLVNQDGKIQKTVTLRMKPGEHKSLYIDQKELFPGVDNFSGSLSVSSPQGLAALALRQDKQAFGAIAADTGPILGPFVVPGTPIEEIEPNDTASQAQAISGTILISGNISSRTDLDAFRFSGRRGDIVSVICDTQGLNSSLDSILFIANSSSAIAWNDENGLYRQGDSFLQAVLPADGTYYLVVGDSYYGGGANYNYRLHIRLASATP